MSPVAVEAPKEANTATKGVFTAEVDASLPSALSPSTEVERLSAQSVPTRISSAAARWVTVCKKSDLLPGRGVAALINNRQYALFLTNQGELFAVDNRDPFCDANVMARGIIGDRNGEPKVASPMLKQTFSLQTGICFEDPTFTINTYQIRTTPTQTIEIQVSEAPSPSATPA
jgi:nitrite reductase (NADH) small subunit